MMIRLNYNFYLNKDKRLKNKNVYLYVRNRNNSIVLPTGINIDENHWNIKKQRVKTSYSFAFETNLLLDNFKSKVEKIAMGILSENPFISFDNLKSELLNKIKEEQSSSSKQEPNFFEIYDTFIAMKKLKESPSTIKIYNTLRKHLQNFESSNNKKLKFSNIDDATLDAFCEYLLDVNFENNYINKLVRMFRTFLNYAYDKGYIDNTKYKKFKNLPIFETDKVALTMEELRMIENLEVSSALEQSKDLFLFMCYTSVRISDLGKFDIMDVENYIWRFWETKSSHKSPKRIPAILTDKALDIIRKYNNDLPVYKKNYKKTANKINKQIKEICRLAGMTYLAKETKKKGRNIIEKVLPKYKFIACHTGRRTFTSITANENIPNVMIRNNTGHKSDKTLGIYTKADKSKIHELLNDVFK